MRVLLISANREDGDMRVPALGLACVAASAAGAGHETRILDLMIEPEPRLALEDVIGNFRPDAIGVSVRNIDDQSMRRPRFLLDQAREAVARCRESSAAPVILGGAGFSILPRPILDYVGADMGIAGEGESVFPELLARIEAGKDPGTLPGLYRAQGTGTAPCAYVSNLDDLPLPDPHLLARSLAGAVDAPVPVQSRRGCPVGCSYCSTPLIEGKVVRRRSPEAVAEWMARWAAEGFRRFYFVDNTFNLPAEYAAGLCGAILDAHLDIDWRCILVPTVVSAELAGLMARAGCREVSLGFESGSAALLGGMRKPFDPGDVRLAAERLRRAGIGRMGFLLLGGPGETEETARESFDFAESLELEALKITIGVRIYPGTELARVALGEGVIASEAELLHPRFYMARGLEDRLRALAARRQARNPGWIL
ncbi:MAG: radical SAM protein [Acidobacteria bacterium]|nr:radical SAM protein [Acidobacteriota bacterium]